MKNWLKNYLPLIILMFYAVFRLGLLLYFQWDELSSNPDLFVEHDREFYSVANNLLHYGQYNVGKDCPPYSVRPPGYPLLVLTTMVLGHQYWLHLLFMLHILFVAVATAVTYFIVSRMRSQNAGLFAGFLVASYAPYHYVTFMMLREITTLMLFSLLLLLLYSRNYRKWSFIGMGTLLGCMSMVREETVLLIVPCIVAIFWHEGKFELRKWRKPVFKTAAMLGIVMLVLSPWIIRNAIVFKRFQMFSALGGIQLYMGNNPDIGPGKPLNYGYISTVEELKTMPDVEVSRIYFNRAVDFAANNPGKVFKNIFWKLELLYEETINNFNDYIFLLCGLLAGTLIIVIAKIKNEWGRRCGLLAGVAFLYVWGRGEFSQGLFLPNIEFSIIRTIGFIGFFYVLFKKQEPVYCLCYLMLLSANIIFLPQHRQRWIMDLLFILWNVLVVYDVLKFIEGRIKIFLFKEPDKDLPEKFEHGSIKEL
ncbi:MAG: glycosyltransferase family 39 protein [Victivallaceae bacterium]|jgi:hypothetical protein